MDPTVRRHVTSARRLPQGGRSRPSTAAFVVSALTTALLTVALVLWAPISTRLIERADDAGWDESLLLPNQFALDGAIVGGWALSVAATALTLPWSCGAAVVLSRPISAAGETGSPWRSWSVPTASPRS